MKPKPILMNAASVRGILDDLKLQTRRVIKPQPPYGRCAHMGGVNWRFADEWPTDNETVRHCPHGPVGRELWVREMWGICPNAFELRYRADCDDRSLVIGNRWMPAIFMPRWASRLTIQVTDIRAERVQEVGWRYGWGQLWDSIHAKPKPVKARGVITHYVSYPWDDIRETREHRGKPWYVIGNPWVFAYTFVRKGAKGHETHR